VKKPYQPPELRKLELEQLTAEQLEWLRELRAKRRAKEQRSDELER
jgi:hypothetical protein